MVWLIVGCVCGAALLCAACVGFCLGVWWQAGAQVKREPEPGITPAERAMAARLLEAERALELARRTPLDQAAEILERTGFQ